LILDSAFAAKLTNGYINWISDRILTVKLKIRKKTFLEFENLCYIQIIVFDLSYLPLAAVGF